MPNKNWAWTNLFFQDPPYLKIERTKKDSGGGFQSRSFVIQEVDKLIGLKVFDGIFLFAGDPSECLRFSQPSFPLWAAKDVKHRLRETCSVGTSTVRGPNTHARVAALFPATSHPAEHGLPSTNDMQRQAMAESGLPKQIRAPDLLLNRRKAIFAELEDSAAVLHPPTRQSSQPQPNH
ncbi:hypothetical protein MMC32_007694 [Xylographa parallela]|nr:hypothetical protein [Xylographa parallela]